MVSQVKRGGNAYSRQREWPRCRTVVSFGGPPPGEPLRINALMLFLRCLVSDVGLLALGRSPDSQQGAQPSRPALALPR